MKVRLGSPSLTYSFFLVLKFFSMPYNVYELWQFTISLGETMDSSKPKKVTQANVTLLVLLEIQRFTGIWDSELDARCSDKAWTKVVRKHNVMSTVQFFEICNALHVPASEVMKAVENFCVILYANGWAVDVSGKTEPQHCELMRKHKALLKTQSLERATSELVHPFIAIAKISNVPSLFKTLLE